jgi:hypothetical protein
MSIGLITNSRPKKVKEESNGLIQDILALFLQDLQIQLISILTSGLGLFFLMYSLTITSIIFNTTIGSS